MLGQLTIRLKLQGFTETERQKLDSILALAELRLDNLWQIYDGDDADITVIRDISLLESTPRPCIYYVGVDDGAELPYENAWPLEVDEQQVPRLRLLVERFNQIAVELANAEPVQETVAPVSAPVVEPTAVPEPAAEVVEAAPETDAAPAEQNSYAASEVLLDHLAADGESHKLLTFESGEKIFVDGEKDLYFSSAVIETMADHFRNGTPYTVKTLQPVLFDMQVEQAELSAEPMTHLRWYVALMAPSEHLQDELQGKTVSLKRWPDLGLPGCTRLIRLAAFMQSNVSTIENIAEKTNTPAAEVCAFLNACNIEGLVQYSDAEVIHEKKVEDSFKSLLSRISDRVNA